MNLLLDTGMLGQLCHSGNRKYRPIRKWLEDVVRAKKSDLAVFLPEICDYELRRKLLHLVGKGQASVKSLRHLDHLATLLDYLPIETATMRKAAELWADARSRGLPTARDESLDADAILAAQAIAVGGTIITSNRKHLAQFVAVKEWSEIAQDSSEPHNSLGERKNGLTS